MLRLLGGWKVDSAGINSSDGAGELLLIKRGLPGFRLA